MSPTARAAAVSAAAGASGHSGGLTATQSLPPLKRSTQVCEHTCTKPSEAVACASQERKRGCHCVPPQLRLLVQPPPLKAQGSIVAG